VKYFYQLTSQLLNLKSQQVI